MGHHNVRLRSWQAFFDKSKLIPIEPDLRLRALITAPRAMRMALRTRAAAAIITDMKKSAAAACIDGLLIGAVFLLLSCTEAQPSTLDEIAARALPYTSTAGKASVVEGINAFALDLHKRLALGGNGNLFFSPFSIESALAMTYAGARENTESQMATALHYNLLQADLHPAFGAFIADMKAAGARDGYTLSTANAVWGQSDYHFLEDFRTILENSYGAPLKPVDFGIDPDAARVSINTWVSDQTAQRINDLLPDGSIDNATRMVLANAIYFKGTWARTFDKGDTADGSFHLPDGSTAAVPMMQQEAQFHFGQNGMVKILELPYSTGDLSMIFILPLETGGLSAVENALTPTALQTWLSLLSPVEELPVAIPRFGFTAAFRLASELSALGMTDAFSPDFADFSGITTLERLFIGNVFHKAYVNVNEEGTEAAAATAVTVGTTAMPMNDFRADHPFLFFIRHNRSGAILFFGRVTDPRQP
jgi:serpin B